MVVEQLVPETPLSDQNRVFVVCFPPQDIATTLSLPGGQAPIDLHIPLVNLGSTLTFSGDYELLQDTLIALSAAFPPLQATVSGIGKYTPNSKSPFDTVYASIDCFHLHRLQDKIKHTLQHQGFPVEPTEHSGLSVPLAKMPAGSPMPKDSLPPMTFPISAIWLVNGDDRYEYQLRGEALPMPAEKEEEEQYIDLDNLPPEHFEYLTKAQRDKIPDSNFAWPDAPDGPKYPVHDQAHLDAAAKLIGRAPASVQSRIKRNAIRIAKRLGLSIPDTWKEDVGEEQETVVSTKGPVDDKITENKFQPLPRIAQLKVRFLSDNAISRNGRQYPTETVQRLVDSGHNQITAGDIINSYICHSVADEDNPLVVSGKATRIWHEGDGAYALFDIPDTSTGRDMVSLLSGGYIPPTMSLRAANAEMQVVKGKGVPQVVGDNIQLLGIDFTARPGIEDARIQDLVLENAKGKEIFSDSFYIEQLALVENTDNTTPAPSTPQNVVVHVNLDGKAIGQYVGEYLAKEIAMEQAPQTTETTKEDIEELHPNQTLKPLVSGQSQSVSNDPPGSQYTKKYPQLHAGPPAGLDNIDALAGGPPEGLTGPGRAIAKETHDHVASVLGMSCAPKTLEIGRKLNRMAENHLVQVHDMHARHLGYDCVGSYQQMQTPYNVPGDDQMDMPHKEPDADDKMESTKQETKQMSVEEALALLKQNNYQVQAPKTEAEKIQEALEARLEEQRRQSEEQIKQLQEAQKQQLEEMKKLFAAQQPASPRKSLVESTTNEQRPTDTPRARRSFVQEQLMNADWEKLADRSCPLPEGLTPNDIIRHFGQMMILQYNEKYGTGSIQPAHS